MIMKKKKKGEATINLYMNELKGGVNLQEKQTLLSTIIHSTHSTSVDSSSPTYFYFRLFFFFSSFFYSFLYLPSLLHWFPSFLFSTAQEGRFLELGPSISIIFIFFTSFFCLFTFTFTVTFNLTVTHLNSSTNHFIFLPRGICKLRHFTIDRKS